MASAVVPARAKSGTALAVFGNRGAGGGAADAGGAAGGAGSARATCGAGVAACPGGGVDLRAASTSRCVMICGGF